MDIDRARFLELVAVIAAATACGGARTEPAPIYVEVDPRPEPRPASPPPPPPPPPVLPVATSDAGGAPIAIGPTTEDLADPTPAPGTGGIWALPSPAGSPRTCSQLRCPLPAPSQESFRVLMGDCRKLESGLRPEAFQRFMACMAPHSGTRQACDLTLVGADPGQCLERWSEPPTLDPASEAKCRPIVARCNSPRRSPYSGSGALTMAMCRGIFSVTKPSAEAKMIHCVTEYCDGAPRLCYMPL